MHADAPLHYDPQGGPVGALDLAPYLGPCRVIHAIGRRPLIEWADLAHAVTDLPPRVLVRTYAKAPVDRWDPDLAAYAPEVIERLADRGVQLVGIDTESRAIAKSASGSMTPAFCNAPAGQVGAPRRDPGRQSAAPGVHQQDPGAYPADQLLRVGRR